ncbi:MAG: type II secretion system major pseudopilin GspG [Pirellulaceae bacterium]|jgi:general secretion pathway protein G|nr:type II secretion system major pseudopilin GspG [Pirellulaceae bacterium]
MNRRKNHRAGFTLLELMIVLVILVLLFAMVGPRLLGSQKKADIKAAQTQIGNFESALNLYAVEMRTFPSTEDGLQALFEPPADERSAAKWDGPYLDGNALPLDPWDNPYQYEYPAVNNRRDFPDIWSWGPDGEADTDDDIVNWQGAGVSEEGGDVEPRDSKAGGGKEGRMDTGGASRADTGGRSNTPPPPRAPSSGGPKSN